MQRNNKKALRIIKSLSTKKIEIKNIRFEKTSTSKEKSIISRKIAGIVSITKDTQKELSLHREQNKI
ncbi:MAG: hypothetical protein AAFO95_11605, partial [Cyanobacteria bacterium J06600_6]